jgi:hypothetical protein
LTNGGRWLGPKPASTCGKHCCSAAAAPKQQQQCGNVRLVPAAHLLLRCPLGEDGLGALAGLLRR